MISLSNADIWSDETKDEMFVFYNNKNYLRHEDEALDLNSTAPITRHANESLSAKGRGKEKEYIVVKYWILTGKG